MGNITDERPAQSELESVKDRVQDVAEQAKEHTRSQLQEQIDTRSTQVGEQVSSAAQAMRRSVVQLREEGNDRAASVVEAVVDRGERLGTYLSGADGDRLIRDIEDFARRQPWLMAGAGALTGFLASRFVKASSDSRYQASRDSSYQASRDSREYGTPAADSYAQRPASPSAVGSGSGVVD